MDKPLVIAPIKVLTPKPLTAAEALKLALRYSALAHTYSMAQVKGVWPT